MEKKTLLEIFRGKPEIFEKYFSKLQVAVGDVIFKEGDPGDSVFFVEKGSVNIKKSMDREGLEFKILAIISEGNFFGEMAVLEDVPRTACAVAAEDSILYSIKSKDFFEFVRLYPQEGFTVFSQLTRISLERLQHTSKELTLLYDISRLLIFPYTDEKDFLRDIVKEVAFYFEGDWNIESFFYNFYNDEYEQAGSDREFESSETFKVPAESGWIDSNTYAMTAVENGRLQAYIIFDSRKDLNITEKNNWATIFNTISFILGSGLKNIASRKELNLINKLKDRKNSL